MRFAEWPERVWCHHGIRPQEAKLTEWWPCLVNNVARKPTSAKVLPSLLSVYHSLPRNTMTISPTKLERCPPQGRSGKSLAIEAEDKPIATRYTLGCTARSPSRELTLPPGTPTTQAACQSCYQICLAGGSNSFCNDSLGVIQVIIVRAWLQARPGRPMNGTPPENWKAHNAEMGLMRGTGSRKRSLRVVYGP